MLMLSACGGGSKPPEPTPTGSEPTSETATPTMTVEPTEEPVVEVTPDADPAQTLLDAAELTTEGLLAMVADKDAVTIVEWEAVILSRAKFEIDQETLWLPGNCPAVEAYYELNKYNGDYTAPSLEEQRALEMKFLTHPEAIIRAFSISQMQNALGVSDEHSGAVVELLQTDKDPIVIKAALSTFQNELAANAEFGKLAFEYAKSDDARIRAAVAYAFGSPWNKGLEGGVEAIIELLADSEQIVRSSAARGSAGLDDDRLIEPLVAILNNDEDASTHGDAIYAIVSMWYDFPLHDNYSEAAYDATLAYYKKTPRTVDIPTWYGLSGLKQVSEDKLEVWKETATFFKPADLCSVLAEIAKDTEATFLIRKTCVEVISVHGTEENLESLKNTLSSLAEISRDDQRVIDEIDKALENL